MNFDEFNFFSVWYSVNLENSLMYFSTLPRCISINSLSLRKSPEKAIPFSAPAAHSAHTLGPASHSVNRDGGGLASTPRRAAL